MINWQELTIDMFVEQLRKAYRRTYGDINSDFGVSLPGAGDWPWKIFQTLMRCIMILTIPSWFHWPGRRSLKASTCAKAG
jgi:hypothetical protein